LDFKEFSYGRAPSFARALCWFDAISLSLNKEMAKENQPRGLIPLGTPERANVAALSLRSYLREGEHIQTLRPRFDGKTRARK
jgi:hypothetical protein